MTLALGFMVTSCGAPAPSGSLSTSTPLVSASSSQAAGGTQEPSATPAGPVEFTSSIYPFTLTLPGGVARGAWAPATEEWDGVQRIDHGGRFTDSLRVDDGDLFLFGTPWARDLETFAEVVHDSGVEHHGCRPTPDSVQEVEVAGVPGLVYTMLCTGTRVVRVAFVRDGYGLVAAELLASGSGGQEPIDKLLSRLEGLTWTGP